MRDFVLVFSAAILASILTYALADRTASAQAHTAAVVSDEERGAVRIVIDGEEVARFAADGLHVRHDIRFGGVTTDVGIENYSQDDSGG